LITTNFKRAKIDLQLSTKFLCDRVTEATKISCTNTHGRALAPFRSMQD